MPVILPLDPALTPRAALAALDGLPQPALLHSTTPEHPLGRYSYLAAAPVTRIVATAAEWPSVAARLRGSLHAKDHPRDPALPPFRGGWIGWFAYELGLAFDPMPLAASDPFAVADISLGLYDWVIAWDHREGDCRLISTGIDASGIPNEGRARARADVVLLLLAKAAAIETSKPARVLSSGAIPPGLRADFAPATYRAAVATVVEEILAGEIFQANLTQRFTAPFTGSDSVLLATLERATASPLGAYLATEEVSVFSASPELFLRFDPVSRQAETRPIKGTRPRDLDPERDAALADELEQSEKDRAENVMIVDLLRNDLSRVCDSGTVDVPALCRLESHATVHHLVSVVRGTLRGDRDALDLLAATFPGGSVTGAPKLRAMAILSRLEPVRRGIYCGAIGWLGLDGALETNLAIRTIIVKDGTAAIHAGGGVTAQSDPEAEYRETLDKARALIRALAEAT